MSMKLDKKFWNDRYLSETIGWDVGYPTPPLTEYIDQLEDKSQKILIPGAGHGHEVIYLHEKGFTNVWVCDWAQEALDYIQEKLPDFPSERLICTDFFDLDMTFDLILEQTFFCALNPELRPKYVNKIYELLHPEGKLAGLLFSIKFNKPHPPYGGDFDEYQRLFQSKFIIERMETAHNSIPPRMENEFFITMRKTKLVDN